MSTNNEWLSKKDALLATAAGLTLTLGLLGFWIGGIACIAIITSKLTLWGLNKSGQWVADKQQQAKARAQEDFVRRQAEWDRMPHHHCLRHHSLQKYAI